MSPDNELHAYGSHMVVLALHHLNKCLGLLDELQTQVPEEFGQAAAAFRAAHNAARITDARHALEHAEDRIAAVDHRFSERHYRGDFPLERMTATSTVTGRLTQLRVLEERFDVAPAIEAALALRPHFGGLIGHLVGDD